MRCKASGPLIPGVPFRMAGAAGQKGNRRERALVLAGVALLTIVVFAPTIRNEFLVVGFDALIVIGDPDVQGLSWTHLRAIFTEGRFANYSPLSTLWLAVQYQVFGPNPVGFHVANILLHVTAVLAMAMFVWPLVRSAWTCALAALIFAVHPLQLEAVTLTVQSKTLLSGILILATLLAYQRWRLSGRAGYYWLAVAVNLAACAAKPAAVVVPVLLVLYDYVFVDGRFHLRTKLPFLAGAVLFSLVTLVMQGSYGAVKPPHGGYWFEHALVLSRVTLEMIAALFVPAPLFPIYYYPKSMCYEALTLLSPLGLVLIVVPTIIRRRRIPWTFFGLAWFAIALVPHSNIVPLAQLRPDRYLYLSIAGFAIWAAVTFEHLGPVAARCGIRFHLGRGLGSLFVGVLAVLTIGSVDVWRSNVTAWERIVEGHSWCAVAHLQLARSYVRSGQLRQAEQAYRQAIRLDPQRAVAHLELGRMYLDGGYEEPGERAIRRYLELAPDDRGARALLEKRTVERMNEEPS